MLIPTCAVNVPPYRRLTAAKAITATVLQNARPPMSTTVGTERRQTVLTAVSPIGAIVLPSAKPVMLTIAGTERRLSGLVRVTPVVLITPTAPPKSVPGPANPDIRNREVPV